MVWPVPGAIRSMRPKLRLTVRGLAAKCQRDGTRMWIPDLLMKLKEIVHSLQ